MDRTTIEAPSTEVRDEAMRLVSLMLDPSVARKTSWPLKNEVVEGETIYGLVPEVFAVVARHILTGGSTNGSFTMGDIVRERNYIYVRPGASQDLMSICQVYHDGHLFCFAYPDVARPFLDVANTLVQEGVLLHRPNKTDHYYNPNISYPLTPGDVLRMNMSRDVAKFFEARYMGGDPVDIVISRTLARKLTHRGGTSPDIEVQYGIDTEQAYQLKEAGDGSLINLLPKSRYDRGAAGQDMKPIAAMRKALRPWAQDGLTDRDFELFDIAWKAAFTLSNPVEIVTGQAIKDAYLSDNHSPNSSASSCMSYDKNQDSLQFYAQNPRNIGLVVVKDDKGLILARGLIWTDDTGQRWHDIIYSTERYKRYVAEWCAKENILPLQLDKRSYAARVTLENPWCKDGLPYLDTMRYINSAGTMRREDKVGEGWVPAATSSLRNGWPKCAGCGELASPDEVKKGRTSSICTTCISTMIASPDSERISMMEQGFTAEEIVSVGGGMIAYKGGIWLYDRPSKSLVRVGDHNA